MLILKSASCLDGRSLSLKILSQTSSLKRDESCLCREIPILQCLWTIGISRYGLCIPLKVLRVPQPNNSQLLTATNQWIVPPHAHIQENLIGAAREVMPLFRFWALGSGVSVEAWFSCVPVHDVHIPLRTSPIQSHSHSM